MKKKGVSSGIGKVKNSITSAVSRFFRRFAMCYALIILAMSIIGVLQNSENVMFCSQLLWIALFSFLIAVIFIITDIFAAKNMNLIVVRGIHFVLSYAAFYLTFVAGGAGEMYFRNSSGGTNRVFMIICITFIFIGVYAVAAFFRIGYAHLKAKSENRKKSYDSIYTDNSDNSDN